jgi:hypothetical protein
MYVHRKQSSVNAVFGNSYAAALAKSLGHPFPVSDKGGVQKLELFATFLRMLIFVLAQRFER